MRTNLKSHTLEETAQLLILSPSMNPTRNNILSINLVKYKLSGWRQYNSVYYIDENTKYVTEFINKHKLVVLEDYNTPDRNHKNIKLPIIEIIEFLNNFKVGNPPDVLRKTSTIQYLKYLEKNENLKEGYIFQMAYARTEGRERTLIEENGNIKISNIFTGRSTSGSDVYPGDKFFKIEDFFSIQIHKIKLKHNTRKWDNQVIYTLGIYYPENFEHSFVGIQN
jgi:hypothetical protein